MTEPTEATPVISADTLEALRADVATRGGSIEETREDDGYHVTVAWADGTVDHFIAQV